MRKASPGEWLGHPASGGSRFVLKPLRDEVLVEVDVNLPQWPVARIDELVRRLRRNNQHLAGVGFYRSRAHCISPPAFLDNHDLCIGVLMQPGATTRGQVHPDEGNVGLSMP